MTNFDRALEALESARRPGELRVHPNDAVEALADADLLAPDLPDESWPQVWEVDGFLVTAIEDGGETIELAENEGDNSVGYGWFMDRHLARNLALALLAATNHKEKNA